MVNESESLRRLFNERLVKEEVKNEEKGRRRGREEGSDDVSGKSNEKKGGGRTVGEKKGAHGKTQHACWNWMKQRKQVGLAARVRFVVKEQNVIVAPAECSAYVRGFDW